MTFEMNRDNLAAVIQAAIKNVFDVEVSAELTRPDEQFGDFATNAALQLAGKLGKNPREIAESLAANLRAELKDQISEVTVAGPGFLNIRLSDAALIDALAHPLMPEFGRDTKVLVEYSDPNPLKPLHAGHLYTTLVGDAIARLVECSGAETIRLNYGGDVGLHVGKSLWAIIRQLGGELPEKLADIPESERSAWLGARYVEGNHAYEDDQVAKAEITVVNKRVYQLHENQVHDSAFAKIYWTVRNWSYDYFAELYKQLGVTPFNRFIPESEVTPLGLQTVKDHVGTIYQESDGAVIFKGEDYGLHTRVFINSEGLPTYEAKEVGLLETKWKDYQFDRSIVITANEQAQYMQVVLKSIAQFQPEPIARTTHLTHGVVKLAGGIKMSSRKGNIVSALDILEAAREAGAKTGRGNDETVTLAAVRYAFLKNRIGADVVYDPEESVALEGNSGPYLQYAHARARSILARAAESPHLSGEQLRSDAHVQSDVHSASVLSVHPEMHDATTPLDSGKATSALIDLQPGERTLVRKLTEYPDVVAQAASELLPHYVCTYLYELAQTFNRFYENNRVIGDERENARLSLVSRYADTLRDGLSLLGITAPDTM
jgi:arginyl-tRNA synthetase